MQKISLIAPTRKRPHLVRKVLKSISDTVSNPKNIDILFYIDDDDSVTIAEIDKIINEFAELDISYKIGKRMWISKYVNELYPLTNSPLLMAFSDDLEFKTKNWDVIVNNEFDKVPDQILLVYPKDTIQNEKVATLQFVSRKAIDIVGYFSPPYFEVWYGDMWLHEIYKQLGRLKYLPEVIIEHQHFVNFKRLFDETDRDQQPKIAGAGRVWHRKKHLIAEDIEKLRKHITSQSE